jgi:hypothetical protein
MSHEYNDLPTIDWKELREKYFKECVIMKDRPIINELGIGGWEKKPVVNYAPHDLFEWFKRNIKK